MDLCSMVIFVLFFFFKQKTAYEMRISDWSSDVCSSDLLRYPEEFRDSLAKLRSLPLVVTDDIQVQLGDVANVQIVDGPDMIKSEDARVNGWEIGRAHV